MRLDWRRKLPVLHERAVGSQNERKESFFYGFNADEGFTAYVATALGILIPVRDHKYATESSRLLELVQTEVVAGAHPPNYYSTDKLLKRAERTGSLVFSSLFA